MNVQVICPGCGEIVPRQVLRHGNCPDCQHVGRPVNVAVWTSRRFRQQTRPAVLARDDSRRRAVPPASRFSRHTIFATDESR